MDQFIQIGDKFVKPVAKVSGVIMGLLALNAIGKTLFIYSSFKKDFGDLESGWFSFLYVIFWIAFVALILCGAFVLLKKFMGVQSQSSAAPTAQAVNAVPQQAASNQFCTKCGASVPAGQQFCNSCGNKM